MDEKIYDLSNILKLSEKLLDYLWTAASLEGIKFIQSSQ